MTTEPASTPTPTPAKPLIWDQTLDDLKAQFKAWDDQGFRAKQLWQALYVDLVTGFQYVTTLRKPLRARLAAHYRWDALTLDRRVHSTDGQTEKRLYTLHDGLQIETVLMRYDDRRTVCISTQAGCALGCIFCATGQMGFKRHLSPGEIVAQVIDIQRELQADGDHVTNVVFMGMGEPFHNYDNTMAAVDILTHPDGFNLGARRLTISTAGMVPEIERFAAEKRQVGLAISLHSTDDQRRTDLMPINKRWPIERLIQACHTYVEQTGRRVTFEWALIAGENDSTDEANRLADLLRGLRCHVNIIPLNPTGGYSGQRATEQAVEGFRATLESRNIPCTVRVRRGIDIAAGCGQLAALG